MSYEPSESQFVVSRLDQTATFCALLRRQLISDFVVPDAQCWVGDYPYLPSEV